MLANSMTTTAAIAPSLAGPYLMVCVILALAGLAKVASPRPAREAIAALGVRVPLLVIRVLGTAEIALAIAAALKGGEILPSLVGMAYVAFAGFVVIMLTRGDAVSCGCFGSASTPPSWLHVTLNIVSATAAFGASGIDGLATTIEHQAGAGIPLLGFVLVGSYLLFILLTVLPVVMAPPQAVVGAFKITSDRHE